MTYTINTKPSAEIEIVYDTCTNTESKEIQYVRIRNKMCGVLDPIIISKERYDKLMENQPDINIDTDTDTDSDTESDSCPHRKLEFECHDDKEVSYICQKCLISISFPVKEKGVIEKKNDIDYNNEKFFT